MTLVLLHHSSSSLSCIWLFGIPLLCFWIKLYWGFILGLNHAPISHSGEKRPAALDQDRNAGSSKRPRQPVSTTNAASVPTANLDADDPWEEDYTEEELKAPNNDPSSSSDDGDDDESDEEDEEALLAELAKIKRERAEEAVQAAAEKKAAEETIRMENILKGNPLLNNNSSSGTLNFKP